MSLPHTSSTPEPIGALDLFGSPGTLQLEPCLATRKSRRRRRKTRLAVGALATTLTLFGVLTSEAHSSDIRAEREPTQEVARPESLTVWVPEDPQPKMEALESKHWSQVTVPDEPAASEADPSIVVEEVPLGIDLATRSHEVRKLLHAGFGMKMSACGYDPEDVLQEIYKGLLARNQGKCPWDARKSSFGHYVHMVCDCVLKNYHRKYSRIRQHEQIGVMNKSGKDGWCEVDAALAARSATNDIRGISRSLDPSNMVADSMATTSLHQHLLRAATLAESYGDTQAQQRFLLAAEILPLKAQGMTRAEIVRHRGLSITQVSKGLAALREGASEWAIAQGLRS